MMVMWYRGGWNWTVHFLRARPPPQLLQQQCHFYYPHSANVFVVDSLGWTDGDYLDRGAEYGGNHPKRIGWNNNDQQRYW